jgi:uncharacterized NAD(P)/FAD-binding protein YdhS
VVIGIDQISGDLDFRDNRSQAFRVQRLQSLKQPFALLEGNAFLRHARAFWDVHRHRLSPRVAQQVLDMRSQGRLRSWRAAWSVSSSGKTAAWTWSGDRAARSPRNG